jgi:acyl-ACP thioesterase
MNESFEKEFYLRTADFDCRMDLQPASILDLFQDVAGEHARLLGIGRDAMLEKQLIWVIVKVRYRILSMPKQFDRVRVKTWPLPPRRSLFQREYKIMAEDGTPLVLGSSEWVVIHAERRRLMPIGDVYPLKDGFLEERNFEDGFMRLTDFSGEGISRTILPLFSELDVNGHVNNTKYANYIMDTVNPREDEHVAEFQIEYHREVQPGHPLTLLAVRGEGQIDVKGTDADGARMFTARITL